MPNIEIYHKETTSFEESIITEQIRKAIYDIEQEVMQHEEEK